MDNKYELTHNIVNRIVEIEKYNLNIANQILPNTYFQEIYEKIQAEEIERFSELVGATIGYTKALDIQRGKILPSAKTRIFSNIRNVHEYIRVYNSHTFLKPSMELSIHMNKLLTKKLVDEWEGGKLRTFSEKPDSTYDTWYSLRDYYPTLNPKKHFDSIYEFIADPKLPVHKLIRVSILLYEYIDKAPFTYLNQLSTLSTIRILLYEYGYNYKNMLPLIKNVYTYNEGILDAFKISKSKRNLTFFIETFLELLSITTLDLQNSVTNIYQNKVKKYFKYNDKLNPRQIRSLEYLEVEKKITRSQYVKMHKDITFMTAFRDLQEMLSLEIIQVHGVGRGTYYTLFTTEAPQEEVRDKKVFGSINV